MPKPNPPPQLNADARPATPPWLASYVHLLDDFIRIPGTDIRIGLDPLLGFFFPGAGDVLTGISTLALIVTAMRHGVPVPVLLRMLAYVAVDAAVGSIPVLGDLFDAFFRANVRNLELLERHASGTPAPPSPWAVVILVAAILVAVMGMAAPLVLLVVLATRN